MTKYNSEAEESCATWRELDAKWDTPVLSPLHHDNRCTLPNHINPIP